MSIDDQFTFDDPVTRYGKVQPPVQHQPEPAVQGQMTPVPDLGEFIRVNVVAPGPVWTALQVSGGVSDEQMKAFDDESTYQRAGQPAELAPAYVFLASPESSYVSGETLNVNGAMPTP